MSEGEILEAALKLSDSAERAVFLDQACAGDLEARERIEGLLPGHAPRLDPDLAREPEASPNVSAMTEAPAIRTADFEPDRPASAPSTDDENTGTVIAGRYALTELIGQGGMGSVYRADQTDPVKRRVALKLIKTGMDSREVIARFEAERQALALMDHPNIARVFDGGVTADGRPYFVMELVDGVPLAKYCDAKRLTVHERLELFVLVCRGVQHAHQKGIIHRDLKPSNVLVTEVDGRPTPKIIDFGLVKPIERKLTDLSFADTVAIVGTPMYMSPEQADPSSRDIDTRTDVYALGVMLYELITGSPPIDATRFQRAAFLEVLRMVREFEPLRPSARLSGSENLPNIAANRKVEPTRLSRMLQGELDWVVMKAIEKDRNRRYETANGLARDLERFLAEEVVEARPPSTGYRLRKFVKRHKLEVIAASLLILSLIGGIAGTTTGLIQARHHASRATAREEQAIDAVKRFRDAVIGNPELKNTPSLENLRKTLLQEPLAFFESLREQLEADNDTSRAALERLASAAFDLGVLSDEICDRRNALRAYQQALAIEERLARESPEAPRHRRNLALCRNNIGILLSATGRPAEAMESYIHARDLWERLAEQYPSDAAIQSELARCLNNIAILWTATGKPPQAFEAYERAREILANLSRTYPRVIAYLDDLALCHNNIGVLESETGKRAEAVESYTQALEIRELLTREVPTDAGLWNKLAECLNNLGNLQREWGRPDEALESYTRAFEIQQRLSSANPAVIQFQSNLAGSYWNIGNIQSETGRRDAALTAYIRAREILERLAEQNPQVIEFQGKVAVSHLHIGIIQKSTDGPAMESFTKARQLLASLAKANPTFTDFQHERARIDMEIGDLQNESGMPAQALESYESAREIIEGLVRQSPTMSKYQLSLAGILNRIGLARSVGELPDRVMEWFTRARRIQERLAGENPNEITALSDLANSHTNIGSLHRAAGNPREALESQSQAVAIRSRLAREHPSITRFRVNLASSLYNIGNLQSQVRLPTEALQSYDQARVILEQLIREDPAVTQNRRTLARCNNIGAVHAENGRPEQSLACDTRALEIRLKLVEEHPDVPDFSSELATSLNNTAILDLNKGSFAEALKNLRRAIDAQRKALAANPGSSRYRKLLKQHFADFILASRALGDPEGVADAQRQLDELEASDPRFAVLNARLAAIAGGEPAENDVERLALAQRAYDTKRHSLAARLWSEALVGDPKLADDRETQHRYNAACASSLAAAGVDRIDPPLDDAAKARLRDQALSLLRAELAAWTKLLSSAAPDERRAIAQTLEHWRIDPDLSSLRADAIEVLPDDEHAGWRALWADVDDILTKASRPQSLTTPE